MLHSDLETALFFEERFLKLVTSSLRAQNLTLLIGSLLLMLAVALAGFFSLSQELRSYRELIEGPQQMASLINEANVSFKTQVQEWKNVLLRGSSQSDRDRYWRQFQDQEREVQALLSRVAAFDLPGELDRNVHSVLDEHKNLGRLYQDGLQEFISGGLDPTYGDTAVRGIDRATSDQMVQLVLDINNLVAQEVIEIRESANSVVTAALVFMIIAFLVITAVAIWLIGRQLVNPITGLIGKIEQLSNGKFDEEISSTRQDEIGILARAANQLREFLAETAAGLGRTTNELNRASGELNTVATRMKHSTNEQFSRTDQVATAMQEMSATAGEVARYASQASVAADEAEFSSQDGSTVMTQAIGSMQELLSEIQATAEVIHRLEEDSGRIGTVLEVIQNVADQTNLLALNAAIEAARAGEAGRGFAVVADEVRTLAHRTSESTAEIQSIISSVQSGAHDAAKAIESGRVRSDESMQQVNRAGNSLQEIASAVERIRDMNRQIATAAEEQTSVSEDIARNITEITDIAATTQTETELTADASKVLEDLSEGLAQLTARLQG